MVAWVHFALVRLHLPGSVVHSGGAQVLIGVQGFSGLGGNRLHPVGV
jgi:hypothetical protein